MRYLVDTNMVSSLAPSRPDRLGVLVDWMDRNSDELFLSVVTATEIRDGIAKARREGATRKAQALGEWWDTVEHLYATRILPFDLTVARIAGALTDRARAAGMAPGFADTVIAATADCHALTLLTRNMRHFRSLGIAVIDPFAQLPPG